MFGRRPRWGEACRRGTLVVPTKQWFRPSNACAVCSRALPMQKPLLLLHSFSPPTALEVQVVETRGMPAACTALAGCLIYFGGWHLAVGGWGVCALLRLWHWVHPSGDASPLSHHLRARLPVAELVCLERPRRALLACGAFQPSVLRLPARESSSHENALVTEKRSCKNARDDRRPLNRH
jgi:hypothetical protein